MNNTTYRIIIASDSDIFHLKSEISSIAEAITGEAPSSITVAFGVKPHGLSIQQTRQIAYTDEEARTLINDIHRKIHGVKAVLFIDTSSHVCNYNFMKSSDTSHEDAADLAQGFINQVQKNLIDSSIWGNW